VSTDTDRDWEAWGSRDPYYGVLTEEKFRGRTISAETRAEFFASGRAHVDHVLDVCRRHLDPGFAPARILDFGCGTGRLVIPFAAVAREVVGLDISDSMLAEARRNCAESGLANVELRRSDDALSNAAGGFDLVHSFIVLQHIEAGRGLRIFERLLERLNPGGIAALQLTYSKRCYRDTGGVSPQPTGSWTAMIRRLGRRIEREIRSLVRGRRTDRDPAMLMSDYDATAVLFMIQSLGVDELFTEFTDHGGSLGMMLFFRRPAAP
jgi:SAM-dependent methyltransferase